MKINFQSPALFFGTSSSATVSGHSIASSTTIELTNKT